MCAQGYTYAPSNGFWHTHTPTGRGTEQRTGNCEISENSCHDCVAAMTFAKEP